VTNEELEAIRAKVADDVVLPTAMTLALIDALKDARAGWAGAASLATTLAAREADLLRWRTEWEAYKASVKAGAASAFSRGAEAMREALIDRVRDSMMQGFFVPRDVKQAVEGLRSVPIPEDKP
jgi:uncharacterized protein (DUF885 family)